MKPEEAEWALSGSTLLMSQSSGLVDNVPWMSSEAGNEQEYG